MDNQNFKQVMAILGEHYARKLSPLLSKSYWEVFKPYTNEQVEQAVFAYLGDPDVCNYWPQPGSIIGKIIGTEKQLSAQLSNEAGEYWALIIKHVTHEGGHKPLELPNAAERAVRLCGGISAIGKCPESDLPFKRRDFVSAYVNDYVSSGDTKQIMSKREAEGALQHLQNQISNKKQRA